MIDLLNLKINSTLDLSLVLFIIGIFSYYFGKLIEETSSNKENKQVTYMSGMFFIFLFIALPLLIIYQFYDYIKIIPKSLLGFILFFVSQTILFFILHKKVQAYQLMKAGYDNLFGEKVEANTSKLIKSIGISRFYSEGSARKTNEKILLSKLPPNWLFIISLIQMWIFVNAINSEVNLLFQFIVFAYLFLGLSNTAVLYGWNSIIEYPSVIVYLSDKKIISGRLMKIEDDYLNVRDENKVYHINKEQVMLIERKEKVDTSKAEAKIEKADKILKSITGVGN